MSETTINDLGLTDASCACGTHSHRATGEAAAQTTDETNTFEVLGMTCSHCVASVTKEIGKLARPDDVSVTLVPGGASLVTVAGAALDRAAVAAAIDEAGYELVAQS
jgi:copper chaperone